MMDTREMRQIQEMRQKAFPPDRIAFCQTRRAVDLDMMALKEWAEGGATFDWLRAQVARNNYLDQFFPNGMIPVSMMQKACKDTGWRRHR